MKKGCIPFCDQARKPSQSRVPSTRIETALCADTHAPALEERDPGRFRNYLKLLAELEMGSELAPRLDPSDLVQETLLKAYRSRDQFRGASDEAYLAWLRVILSNTLGTALRHHHRNRRDLRREGAA